MKLRNTLLLYLALGCLIAFVVVYERKVPTTNQTGLARSLVVDFEPEKIEKMLLINNEERIELVKHQGRWFLNSPIKDKADSNLAETLLDTLYNLHPSAVLNEEKKEVETKPFGTMKSNMRLQLFGAGAPPEIIFGKSSAIEGQIYLGLANSSRVYVVSEDLKNLVAKKTDDFRDRSLMEFPADQADRLAIHNSDGEILLQKENEHWQIAKPIRARANDALIKALVTKIVALHAKGFVADKDLARLSEPFGTIALHRESAREPALLSLIEAPEAPDCVYAKLSGRSSVFILDKPVAGLLKAHPNDLRDRHLMRLNFDMVDRISLQPAAKPKLLLARNQENWVLDGKPADGNKVAGFIDYLLGQKVVAFVADTASDLEKYGLNAPLMKITFSSYASENTPESKAGERQIASLLLGRIENGEVFAKLEEEPFVVSVDKAILDRLPDASWQAAR